MVEHSGEINAWFIARFGWADISALMTRGSVGSPLAAAGSSSRLPPSRCSPRFCTTALAAWAVRWLRRAWHWRTLAMATIVFVLFFVLPWRLTTWRPAVPPTWVEPTVAGLRLFAAVLLWSFGAALLVLLSVSGRAVAPPTAVAAEQP